uniref:Mitochondrial carrier protein n=1 Tax=Panagrellus redivivus TaxID=6233 RepID=A0A7E4W1H7_PANRE
MSMSWEPVRQGRVIDCIKHGGDYEVCRQLQLKQPNAKELNVIEWDHMNLKMFYPMALTSTWTVRTVLYPLAVLRARLQLQKQSTVYRSTWHAFTNIAKYEGVRGLYRGFWVTVPQIGTSFIYSTVYEKLRAILQYDYGYHSVAGISSIAGGTASFCSQVIFVPTDIIAQHMMIYNYADKFVTGSDKRILEYLRRTEGQGTLGLRVVKAIYHCDGLPGFYRAFWASSLVYAPSCFVFWPAYYYIQDMLKYVTHQKYLLLDQAIAATLGGAASTIATNPMEVFRIRLQVQRGSYKETAERLIRNEGWTIFTKGLPPRLISNSIYSGIVMVGYEVVKRFCVLPEYKSAVKW